MRSHIFRVVRGGEIATELREARDAVGIFIEPVVVRAAYCVPGKLELFHAEAEIQR